MLYTDTQEVGGAWTDGRGLLLSQKLTALTQLGTQTANAQMHTQAHANTHAHTHTRAIKKRGWNKGDSFVSPPPHSPV